MSDRVAGAPTLETRMDDVRRGDGCGRVRARCADRLLGGSAHEPALRGDVSRADGGTRLVGRVRADAVGCRLSDRELDEEYRRELEADLRLFGTRAEAEEVVRSIGRADPETVRRLADYYRRSASPGAVESLSRMNAEIDVRHVLPVIRVPTLVVHGDDDRQVPFARGRYLAERIPGARLVPFAGGHVPEGAAATDVVAEIERFLAEVWETDAWDEVVPERVLSTVLFTDIVGSSDRVVELGDRRWRDLLERHHTIVRRQLLRFRGIEVDTAGDGFFASFDGPARAIRCALLHHRRRR